MLTGGPLEAGSPPSSSRRDDGSLAEAPLGRRAVARLVDFAVGVAFFAGLVIVLNAASGSSPDGTGVMVVAITGTFLAYLLYEVAFVAAWGRTLGKQLTGLAVIRLDGARPGLRRAFLRALVPSAVLLVFFPLYPVVYFVTAFVAGHRWPNDRLAGTRVVLRG